MNRQQLSIVGLIGMAISMNQADASRWNGHNNPGNLHRRYEMNFDELPLEGEMSHAKMPWSGIYWPNKEGGISARWNDPYHDKKKAFKYPIYSRFTLEKMSMQQLERLSPAEKYDIYRGRYDFPTVKAERKKNRKGSAEWHGICHGWSPASIHYAEPAAVVMTNPDGIRVPFGSSDVKALLSYYYGVVDYQPGPQVGLRCQGISLRGACKDVNAGAFHVVLTNQIGLLDESFNLDIDRTREIWNQPVTGYKTRVLSRRRNNRMRARRTGVHTVYEVRTVLTYANDDRKPSWEPVMENENDDKRFASKTLEYTVEVNGWGQVVGGNWISHTRPDFLWTRPKVEFKGYYQGIGEIFQPAVAPRP